MSTRIYQRDGATRTRIDVIHKSDGSVTVSGYDWGSGPESYVGRDELDYELTIPAHAVPAAITALLRAVLAPSETPITTLRAALDADRVEHRFHILP